MVEEFFEQIYYNIWWLTFVEPDRYFVVIEIIKLDYSSWSSHELGKGRILNIIFNFLFFFIINEILKRATNKKCIIIEIRK